MRILTAEDQEMARFILARHLRGWGYEVVETSNGMDALKYLMDNPLSVDMLITDWSMPGMDGLELARRVREFSDARQYIYVILLTSRGELHDILKGFSEGKVDDYMTKPFEVTELQMRVQVGCRLILSERTQRQHGIDLEAIVRRQTEAIRETQDEIISRLFNALESRDEETSCHVRRIGILSAYLGELLGLSPARIDLIKAASPLHDIGKIGIPDNVLRKPGPLSTEEFSIIKQHTSIGERILSGSRNQVIQTAAAIARSHHENWDGSGYPQGLKGKEIPLEARIVSVVDVYDALLSDRVYRKGLPEDEVLSIIAKGIGNKFDPEICRLFLDRYDQIRAHCREQETDHPLLLEYGDMGALADTPG
ncbi:MAG: response regulator [Candidatus Accumulibacter sp.]|jgi:putative two-component system response regulator|nr:response regulator [Accumulibacter sp.]